MILKSNEQMVKFLRQVTDVIPFLRGGYSYRKNLASLGRQDVASFVFKTVETFRKRELFLKETKSSQRTTKPTIRSLWPAKTQISLYIHPV